MRSTRTFIPDSARSRAAFEARGLTREEVAVRAKVSYPTVLRVLCGLSVSRFTAAAVAKVLRVRPQYFEQKSEAAAVGAA